MRYFLLSAVILLISAVVFLLVGKMGPNVPSPSPTPTKPIAPGHSVTRRANPNPMPRKAQPGRLPPTAIDDDPVLKDEEPNAYEKLLDGLLTDPTSGMKAGQEWLDQLRSGSGAKSKPTAGPKPR